MQHLFVGGVYDDGAEVPVGAAFGHVQGVRGALHHGAVVGVGAAPRFLGDMPFGDIGGHAQRAGDSALAVVHGRQVEVVPAMANVPFEACAFAHEHAPNGLDAAVRFRVEVEDTPADGLRRVDPVLGVGAALGHRHDALGVEREEDDGPARHRFVQEAFGAAEGVLGTPLLRDIADRDDRVAGSAGAIEARPRGRDEPFAPIAMEDAPRLRDGWRRLVLGQHLQVLVAHPLALFRGQQRREGLPGQFARLPSGDACGSAIQPQEAPLRIQHGDAHRRRTVGHREHLLAFAERLLGPAPARDLPPDEEHAFRRAASVHLRHETDVEPAFAPRQVDAHIRRALAAATRRGLDRRPQLRLGAKAEVLGGAPANHAASRLVSAAAAGFA